MIILLPAPYHGKMAVTNLRVDDFSHIISPDSCVDMFTAVDMRRCRAKPVDEPWVNRHVTNEHCGLTLLIHRFSIHKTKPFRKQIPSC